MSIQHKISGFLTAVVLAIVSFLVIYFFCPQFSRKSLGISFREPSSSAEQISVKQTETKIRDAVDRTEKAIKENVVKSVSEKVDKIDLSYLLDD